MDHSEVTGNRKSFDYNFIVHTFGCKVNTYDSGLIQKNINSFKNLQNYNSNNINIINNDESQIIQSLDKKNSMAVHVLNTCAVTAEATNQAIRLIRKIKAKEPLATIVITGCAAQVDTGSFEKIPAANLIVANSHKGLLPQILDQYFKGLSKDRIYKSNIFKKDDLEIGGGEEKYHTRSFLKIQDGCNSFCSFCIIPYARGKSRSISINEIVKRINDLEIEGLKEVVLTGVHIGDYEDHVIGEKKCLEDLVENILVKTKISRIRLSSLEPVEVTDRLLELYQDKRLCSHFHMSIQSANTQVLKEMKRQYLLSDVEESLIKIHNKVKNVFVGMDVIAGFPTETEEMFEETYKVLADLPWTRLHVFPYSERQGTKAAVLPQLHQMIRKERSHKLRELSHHRLSSEALKQINDIKDVLLLKSENNKISGLSRDYWNINVDYPNTSQQSIDHKKIETTESYKNTEKFVKIDSILVQTNDVILKGHFYDN